MLAHHLLLESFLLQLIFALRVVLLHHDVCFLGFLDLAPPLGFSPRSYSLVPLLFLVPSNEPVHRVKSARCRHPSVLSVDLIPPLADLLFAGFHIVVLMSSLQWSNLSPDR
jgi:hypothetical protein